MSSLISRRPDKCLVIIPFDKKIVSLKGKARTKAIQIDFETYFDELLSKAIEMAGLEPLRVKDTGEQQVIHQRMFDMIRTFPMVLADLTYDNPNVLYEIGVRHALARNGTILVRLTGSDRYSCDAKTADASTASPAIVPATDIVFDISGLTIHPLSPKRSDASLDEQVRDLALKIIACRDQAAPDSPVFVLLPGIKHQIGAIEADKALDLLYETTEMPGTFVGIRAGRIEDLTRSSAAASEADRTVDIWCNSENNRLEMARMHERSVSSVIRHLGSKSLIPTHPDFDSVQSELRSVAAAEKGGAPIDVGDVFQTSSGGLETKRQQVVALLHVVSVVGHPGHGYRPASDGQLRLCMTNVLEKARAIAHRAPVSGKKDYSLLVPLFSSGQAGNSTDHVARVLVKEAVRRVGEWNPAGLPADLTKIYFSAYTVADVDAVRRALELEVQDGRLKPAD